MTIRPYLDADWDAVCEIHDLSKPDELRGSVDLSAIRPLRLDPAMVMLFAESVNVVAEDQGRVVAYGGYQGNYISSLFVHPGHRRKGIGRALVHDMLGRLTGAVTLNVATNNAAARQLYASMGFVVEKEFTGQFHGQDIRIMTLRHRRAARG